MSNEVWEQWSSIHDDADQRKRQESAKKTACTPTFVDFTKQTGTFVGSSGHHTTALDHCTCVDFNRRKLPCKHMYRLAMELGLMDGDYKSDTADIVDPFNAKLGFSKCIALVEGLSPDAQILLKELLYNMNSKDIYRCTAKSPELSEIMSSGLLIESSNPKVQLSHYKMNDLKKRLSQLGHHVTIRKKEELIEWIVDNALDILPDMCSETIVVRVPEGIKYRKIYMYLLRKFDNDLYVDENMIEYVIPHGAIFSVDDSSRLTLQFPDDDITEQLNKYNANRCVGWSL